MFRSRLFWSFILRESLKLLACEIVLVALALLLYSRVNWLQRYYFSDVLFLVGVLEVLTASVGMLGSPYGVTSPYGVPAVPVQASEEELHDQQVAELMEKTSFAKRVTVIGLLTILAAVALLYMK